MKVRCEDCKFVYSANYKKYLVREEPILLSYCYYIRKLGGAYRGAPVNRSTRAYLNKEGHCFTYRRKWWKIWKPLRYVLEIF